MDSLFSELIQKFLPWIAVGTLLGIGYLWRRHLIHLHATIDENKNPEKARWYEEEIKLLGEGGALSFLVSILTGPLWPDSSDSPLSEIFTTAFWNVIIIAWMFLAAEIFIVLAWFKRINPTDRRENCSC